MKRVETIQLQFKYKQNLFFTTTIMAGIIPVFLTAITFCGYASGYANCTIKWSEPLPSWYPLVFNSSGVIYPRKTGSNSDWGIVIRRYANFYVGCAADSSNSVKGYGSANEIQVKCLTSGLAVNGSKVNFTDLGCTKAIREKLVSSGTCYNDLTAINITFESASAPQLPLINICHDSNIDGTLYTHHFIIGASLNPYEVSNSRPSFKEGKYYTTVSANDAYSQSSQLNQMAYLVGSQSLAEKYINSSKSYYFARGHLAPDGDFIHVYEQNSTYYYVNAVPQWQAINNGNWKALESALRSYAKDRNVDLEVWTGGKDVLKLEDVNDNLVEIFLARDSSEKLRIPAPELTVKVVKDPRRNAGVAVFMINNPHLTEVSDRLKACPDLCSQISWITWDTQNLQKGYTYCCDVNTARSVLPYLPPELGSLQLMT